MARHVSAVCHPLSRYEQMRLDHRLEAEKIDRQASEYMRSQSANAVPGEIVESAPQLYAQASTLDPDRYLHRKPFLATNEIRLRRFAETVVKEKDGSVTVTRYPNIDMNDRWWEWEEESGLRTTIEPYTLRAEHTAPSASVFALRKQITYGLSSRVTVGTLRYKELCIHCGHRWFPHRDRYPPPFCPNCKIKEYDRRLI
jgi:hypothetical protein